MQEILQKYKELQDIIAILGMEELSEEDKATVMPCKKDPEIPVPAVPCGRDTSPEFPANTCRSKRRSAALR